MDLIKDMTITTCIYYDLYGTEFGGRRRPRNKYLYGMVSMLKMDCPVVLYCWEKNVEEIKSFIEKETDGYRNDQVKVEAFNLYESPLYEKIKSIKNIEEQKKSDRSFDVSMNKMIMLQKTIDSNFFDSKYFYFIDAGLSSSSLFPNKYLPETSHSLKKYYECSLFNRNLSNSLIELVKNGEITLWKILDWAHFIDSKHCADNDQSSIIAGIYGSTGEHMMEYTTELINKFISIIDEDKILYLEEPIMTILYKAAREKYRTIDFDIWYHEDSGDIFQSRIIGKKSFFNIFEDLNQGIHY